MVQISTKWHKVTQMWSTITSQHSLILWVYNARTSCLGKCGTGRNRPKKNKMFWLMVLLCCFCFPHSTMWSFILLHTAQLHQQEWWPCMSQLCFDSLLFTTWCHNESLHCCSSKWWILVCSKYNNVGASIFVLRRGGWQESQIVVRPLEEHSKNHALLHHVHRISHLLEYIKSTRKKVLKLNLVQFGKYTTWYQILRTFRLNKYLKEKWNYSASKLVAKVHLGTFEKYTKKYVLFIRALLWYTVCRTLCRG